MAEPQTGYAAQTKPDMSAYCVMTVAESRVMAAQGWGGQALTAKGDKRDGNALYLDLNGSYIGADVCQNPLKELLKWVNFIAYKLYLKAVKKLTMG